MEQHAVDGLGLRIDLVRELVSRRDDALRVELHEAAGRRCRQHFRKERLEQRGRRDEIPLAEVDEIARPLLELRDLLLFDLALQPAGRLRAVEPG